MLNKKAQYFILCEDRQTQCFIRYFLEKQNIHRRKIISLQLPMSCGEQYVRTEYPKELQKLRTKNFNVLVLFVCTDADINDIETRYKELDDECKKQNTDSRKDDEPVAIFVPKRNIETWLEWLKASEEDKRSINETVSYPHNRKNESNCKLQA